MSHPPGIRTEDELGAGVNSESNEYMLQRRKSFISFDVFREEYWAHFPQPLTKGLGSSRLLAFARHRVSDIIVQTSHSSSVNSWVNEPASLLTLLLIPMSLGRRHQRF